MGISRRGFIKGAVVGTGVLATGSAAAAGDKRFKGYPGRFGLLHDTTRCVGCRSCEVACTEVNEQDAPAAPVNDQQIFDQVRRTTEDQYTVVNRYEQDQGKAPAIFRKHQCMHCSEPSCAAVCFVKAFTKTPEGPVHYDPDVCVGCRYCVMACPYYALAYEYDKPFDPRVVRCTMCLPRIREGKLPGCAEACPNGAITFGPRKELLQVAHERIQKHPDRYIDHIYGEHEFGGASWMMLAGTEFKNLGLPEDPDYTPLPERTNAFLSVVPLIVSIYPGLLMGFYAWNKRKEKLAAEEQTAAVATTQAEAEEATKQKLAAAATKAAKDKERAVQAAVKKALAEAEKGGDQ